MFEGFVKMAVIETTKTKIIAFETRRLTTKVQLMSDNCEVANDLKIRAGSEKYVTNALKPFDSFSGISPNRPERYPTSISEKHCNKTDAKSFTPISDDIIGLIVEFDKTFSISINKLLI
jgi:hypothetical protein